MIPRLVGLQVWPLRRRSNTPLVQFSPQGARTPPKIRLIACSLRFTTKNSGTNDPLASLRPAPGGRCHLGSPLPYAPDLTDTFAFDQTQKAFRKGCCWQRCQCDRLRRRSIFVSRGLRPRRPHIATIRLIDVFHSASLHSRQMITLAALRPAPGDRGHLGTLHASRKLAQHLR